MTEQCPNDNGKLYAVAGAKTQAWENVFLSEPVKRLQKDFAGYTLTPRDIKDFMEVRTAPPALAPDTDWILSCNEDVCV